MVEGNDGIHFPRDASGRRSTTAAGQAVLAMAVGDAEPSLADAIGGERDWRRRYPRHMVDVVRLALSREGDVAGLARRGLNALHDTFRFVRDGGEGTVAQVMRDAEPSTLHTAVVRGQGERQRRLVVPYEGRELTDDALRRQIDAWTERDLMEPTAAAALHAVLDAPDWLDLRDLTIALLGAGAEVGPVLTLSRLGANIVAVDLDRADIWQRLLAVARAGAGTMRIPLRTACADDANDDALCATAGADLLTRAPEIRSWLAHIDQPLCVGAYAYLHGQHHVRVAVAMDAVMADLTAHRSDVSLAFLLTPTDAFAIPAAAAEAASRRYEDVGMRRLWRRPLRAVSAGRLYAPNAAEHLATGSGGRFAIFDGILPAQGPNYSLAKRLQKWRALLARAEGHRVSANVAPSTSTASVMTRPAFAAAFSGAAHYGVEVFAPATTNAIMAALLIHDLRTETGAAAPSAALAHPLELFMDGAVHGGMWRTGHQLRSVIEVAAARGFLQQRLGRS
jgi:hypothetical protein